MDDTVEGWDTFDAGSVARARASQDTGAQLERFFLTAWQAASVEESDGWAMLASLAVGVGAGPACGAVSAGTLAVACFLGAGALSGATYGGVDYAMTVDREDWDAGDFWTTVGINAAIGALTTGAFMAGGAGVRAAVNAIRSGSTAAARPTLNQVLARGANGVDDVANTAPELAAYGGGRTSGVLVRADGTATNLTSGLNGPSALLAKPRPGMNGNIVGHVESHAAALMRQEGLSEATLWINRMPCGGPNGCMINLSRMVPSGSTLDVFVTPGGSAAGLEDWIIVIGAG